MTQIVAVKRSVDGLVGEDAGQVPGLVVTESVEVVGSTVVIKSPGKASSIHYIYLLSPPPPQILHQ